jgi:AbrB family looped-hinge helix DNA binding protein
MKASTPKTKAAASVTIGAKGQFVIPKEIRAMFSIEPGDTLILMADKDKGMLLVPPQDVEEVSDMLFKKEKR